MKYEDGAELVTLPGYQCKTCKRFFLGDNESSLHIARWCCATDLPCQCGGRITKKSYAYCDACITRRTNERWNAMPETEWDGETALAIWDGEQCFFDAADILDYIEDFNCQLDEDEKEVTLDDLRIVACTPVLPSLFSFADYFHDDMADEHRDGNYSDTDDRINAIIKERFPSTWEPVNVRISQASLHHWCYPNNEKAA